MNVRVKKQCKNVSAKNRNGVKDGLLQIRGLSDLPQIKVKNPQFSKIKM